MVGVKDAIAAGWLVSGMLLFQCHDNHNAGLRAKSFVAFRDAVVPKCHADRNRNPVLRPKSFVDFRDAAFPKCHADSNINPVLGVKFMAGIMDRFCRSRKCHIA